MAKRVDLDHLERLAKAATPGPWLPGDGERVPSDVVSAPDATRDGFDDEDYAHYGGALVAESMCPADREYVAAADPATVLALVAELRVLRSRYGVADEVWCGARRDQAGSAYCVEMAGHERDGVGHMWGQHTDPSTHDRSI